MSLPLGFGGGDDESEERLLIGVWGKKGCRPVVCWQAAGRGDRVEGKDGRGPLLT